jgi:hypothetical protein
MVYMKEAGAGYEPYLEVTMTKWLRGALIQIKGIPTWVPP